MVDTERDVRKLLSPLAKLLGEEIENDIKKQIGQLVVDRISEDINSYGLYLFYPDDYQETIDDAFNSIKMKIKKMYEKTMLEQAEKAVEIFKKNTENAIALNPKVLAYEQKERFEDFLREVSYNLDRNQRDKIVREMQRIYES